MFPSSRLPLLKDEILAKFQCQKSGNCCRRDGVVYGSLTEIKRMAAVLDIEVAAFIERYTYRDNGWYVLASKNHRPHCFLNEKNECRIYEARPTHCRKYPYWPDLWETAESILEEVSLCPGLRKALRSVLSEKGIDLTGI